MTAASLTRPTSQAGSAADRGIVPSLAVTIVAAVILILSIGWSRLSLDDLGLISGLAPTYLVGLALLPIASYLEWRRGGQAAAWLIVLQIVIFIVVVWVTPTILEGTPRFRTSFANYGYVDPLLRGDGLLPSRFIYHNWPLFPILMAGVVSIGVDPLVLLTWFPLVSMLLYLIPLAVIVRLLWSTQAATDPETTAVAFPVPRWPGEPEPEPEAPRRVPPYWAFALWAFPIFDWTGQDYFSPQSFAFLVFLAWAIVLTHVAMKRNGAFTPRTLLLTVALFTVIVSSHVLTALLGLGILFTLVLTRLIRQWTIFITCTLIFLVWQVYIAAPFFEFYREQLLQTILDLPAFLELNFSNRIRGSDGHSFIASLRVLVTIIAFGIGAIAAAIVVRRNHGMTRPLRFVLAWVLGVALVAPVTVYGGEMLIRSLLFTLPMVAALVAMTLRDRFFAIGVAACLLVMAPVHVLTHFGNELYDYVSPGELAGFDFVEAQAPANVYGGSPAGLFESTADLDTRNATVPKAGGPSGVEGYERPEDHAWRDEDRPIYVVVSRGDDAAMQLFQDIAGFKAQVEALAASDEQYEPVFSNEDVSIWLWTPQAATAVP